MLLNNLHLLRRLLLVVIALLLGTVAVVSAQEAGGVLRVSTNAPVELDPALGSLDSEVMFNRALYDALVDIRPDSSITPNLASDWEISEDGLTYTFTLQEGVTFHDGSPLTSADVVYTFNRMVEVGSSAVNILGEFEVEAPDETTVVFTLLAPNADFLYGVGSQFSGIVKDGAESPNVLAEGSDNPFMNFNGTGPFVLQEYQPGERAVLARNENYWQEGMPALASVEFIYNDDPVAQVNALRNGEVDFIFRVPLDQLEVLEGSEGVQTFLVPSNQHPVIRVRADEGFVGSDPRVRQAFKMATDREALNELLLDGRGVIGNNDPIGPRYGDLYTPVEGPAYDPEGACALLAEAGYPDGLNLTLYTPDAFVGASYADLATVLQQQWAEGCINVDIQVVPENVYYGDENQWLEVELGITGWGDRPSPQITLAVAYASDGAFNESHWSDPELDALIAQAAVTADVEERAAIYAQISQIFAERGPVIIPWFSPILGAASANVQRLEEAFHPFPGLTDLRQVSIASS
jgi:peptide/nickel transport system substrate-binding protein